MIYPPTNGHPSSTNPAAHGRESNSQLVDCKSDALTITLSSTRLLIRAVVGVHFRQVLEFKGVKTVYIGVYMYTQEF